MSFDFDGYLLNLPDYLKDVPDEGLQNLIKACDEKIEEHQEHYDWAITQVDTWREAFWRWKRGERKTKPYPLYGGVDLDYCREQYKTWTRYWKAKKEIITQEQRFRRMRRA